MTISSEMDDSTKFLVDWASRIEMEFLSFKSMVSDTLKQHFETAESYPLSSSSSSSSTTRSKSLSTSSLYHGNRDNFNVVLTGLNASVEKLTQKVGSLEQKLSTNPFNSVDESLHTDFKSDIDNLRLLQDQLIRGLTTLSLTKTSAVAETGPHPQDIDDIKYFLKLILPKLMNIENQCNTIADSTERLQKRNYATAFESTYVERDLRRVLHSGSPYRPPSRLPSRKVAGSRPSTPPQRLLRSNFDTSISQDMLN